MKLQTPVRCHSKYSRRTAKSCRQRESRNIDNVIQEPDGGAYMPLERCFVEFGLGGEWTANQLCEVDRPEKTGAIRRQRLFSARICRVNRLAIGEVVERVHTID